MNNPNQKTIDQYLDGLALDESQKEKIILAITHIVYQRNQNAVKAEKENDEIKRGQFLRSIEEYDQIIRREISQVLKGEETHYYEF
ncbi:MAG TPA: hypothetical protein PLR18_02595 [bacterium]|nr:hypothetical protein [bacterium]